MTKSILSDSVLDDVLHDVRPELEGEPEVYTRALRAHLKPAALRVVWACRRHPQLVPRIIDHQAKKRRTCVFPVVAAAFDAFAANVISELSLS